MSRNGPLRGLTGWIGALLLMLAPTALAAQYDVTRIWTACTAGSVNACAEISLRTTSLSTGGTHISVGLSNLQGTSLFDNTGGSLLRNAVFWTGSSTSGAYATSHNPDVTTTGGASAPDQAWRAYDHPDLLQVYAPGRLEDYEFTGDQKSYSYSYYSGSGTHYGDGWYSDVTLREATRTYYDKRSYWYDYYGLAGADAVDGSRETSGTWNLYDYDPGYESRVVCVTYEGDVCVEERTEYRAKNTQAEKVAEEDYYYHYDYLADGGTGSGATVWFTFQTDRLFDARTMTRMYFSSVVTSTGYTYGCDSNSSYCDMLSDVTIDHLSTVPEPGTIALLASGLLGLLGAARIRRRSEIA